MSISSTRQQEGILQGSHPCYSWVASILLIIVTSRRSSNFSVVGRVGVLAVVPIAVGFVVSRMLADPFFALAQQYNPEVFTLTDREKVEGAHEVRKHVLRLRMDAAIGRAPPLVDDELQVRSQALIYTYYLQFHGLGVMH